MKKIYYASILLMGVHAAMGQQLKTKQVSLAISNNAPAKPFEKFGGFFTQNFHPGVEAAYRFDWRAVKKHEWFQGIQAGYFYHRFVQHGITLYTDLGYCYKFNRHMNAATSLGIGAVCSVPATANLVLNDKGEYEFNKNAARLQVIVPLSITMGYIVDPAARKSIKIFSKYEQKLQFSFIKEYVPILPYNSLSIGVARQL